MFRVIYLFFNLTLVAPLCAQGFADFLTGLLQRPVGERQAVVDSLFAHLPDGQTGGGRPVNWPWPGT